MIGSVRFRARAWYVATMLMLPLVGYAEAQENCPGEVHEYDALALNPAAEAFTKMHQLLETMREKNCSAERNERGRIFATYLMGLFKQKAITAAQAQFTKLADFSDDPELLYEAAKGLKQSAFHAQSKQEAQKRYVQAVETVERAMQGIDSGSARSIDLPTDLSQDLVKLSITVRALAPEFISRKYRSVSASDQQSPIEFELNKTTFTTKGQSALQEMAQTFRSAEAGQVLLLRGHTDVTASADHNCKLSHARAEAVRDALKQRGLTFAIAVHGLGESEPPLSSDNQDLGNEQIDQVARRVEALWVRADEVAEMACPMTERAKR